MVDLVFECLGARPEPYAVMPTMLLRLRVSETSGARVDGISLRVQIRIEPTRRRYSADEAARLHDLFGDQSRWGDTLKPLQFTTVAVMVPRFNGSTEIDIPINCTYDLEIASTKYFNGVDGGSIPLLLLFSGTVFTTDGHRLQAHQVPWSKECDFPLPVTVWREMIDQHFPNSAWVLMSRETMDALQRYKTDHALTTWDATLTALLDHVHALNEPEVGQP